MYTLKEGLENQNPSPSSSPSPSPSSNTNTNTNATKPKPVGVNQPLSTTQDVPTEAIAAPKGNQETMKNINEKKKGGSNRIDYASTLEEAYDNLDSILGGDGIKNLTNDTQKLMSKQ
jgi:hypothetical protein